MVPFFILHPVCSRADSKKPHPWILESTQGGANWMIMSLTVSKPVACSKSLTRKLKLLFVSARFFIAALRVSVFLLVTGWSILGRKLFLILRAPAERRAPISRSMLELASGLLVSMWMNSAAVRVLWLFQTCVSFYRTRKNGVCPEYYASYFLLCRRLSFSSRR